MTFSFKGKDKAGEHEDGDRDDEEDETQVLVGLVERVDQALESHEVTNHFEDPQDSHESYQTNQFASFANNLHILETSKQ